MLTELGAPSWALDAADGSSEINKALAIASQVNSTTNADAGAIRATLASKTGEWICLSMQSLCPVRRTGLGERGRFRRSR
mgnify:CR=1 FL=1